MSRTPYFDAYEARRRNRNSRSTIGTSCIGDNSIRHSGYVIQNNVYGNATWTPINSGVVYFPSYRVVKQYNDQGLVSDFTIEMRHNANEEWTPIPEVVRHA